ncbi:thioesterase II family protein [Streptomyces sp. CRN 30]|uniref:thioesterase II family protein n=1 Tax=Streptomyces sp. CRN 30 TaxID=3075613 RepID=UPI002A7F8DE8|nr:thioesterase domain-containing protein [Streptomyces sp. CRN 30]
MNAPPLKRLSGPPPAGGNVVCFPYAGGGPSVFRTWPGTLSGRAGVWAAHLGGREGRFEVSPGTELKQQVDELVEAVRPLTGGPLAFYGHSLGATLAAHVAQEVFPAMSAPSLLVVAARTPEWSDPVTDPSAPALTGASSDEEVLAAFRWTGGVDEALLLAEPELLELVMPCLRADALLAADRQYLREGALTGPVLALHGTGDPKADAAGMESWNRFTTGAFTSAAVPGGHLFCDTSGARVAHLVTDAAMLCGVLR